MSLIDATIPAGLDRDGMSADERHQFDTAEAARVLTLIIRRVPTVFRVPEWTIRNANLDIMLSGRDSDHAQRAHIMALAEQFGFEYAERPHGGHQNIVTASGLYQSVPVKFWRLVHPCSCGCAVTS